ncbi:MAG: hypothetical protein FWE16_02235 [Firmicutes bacterium]|nr:hypothetical protein [Bacillota bacterium]
MSNLFSYIDPATTAILWQILVGVFVAFSLAIGIWWKKVTLFFRGVFVKGFNKKECDSVNKYIFTLENDLSPDEIEVKLEELNDQGIREITIVVSELDPKLEFLIDKYGIEFEVAEQMNIIKENINENI